MNYLKERAYTYALGKKEKKEKKKGTLILRTTIVPLTKSFLVNIES
jgi:hypothetical protein